MPDAIWRKSPRRVEKPGKNAPRGGPGLAFRRYPVIVRAKALVAQLDRASDFESEGREFESLRARHERERPFVQQMLDLAAIVPDRIHGPKG